MPLGYNPGDELGGDEGRHMKYITELDESLPAFAGPLPPVGTLVGC